MYIEVLWRCVVLIILSINRRPVDCVAVCVLHTWCQFYDQKSARERILTVLKSILGNAYVVIPKETSRKLTLIEYLNTFLFIKNSRHLTIPIKMAAVHLTIMLCHLKSTQITELNIVYHC